MAKIQLTPDQAGLVAILAQAQAEGAELSEFDDLLRDQDEAFLGLVKLLFGEVSSAEAPLGGIELVRKIKDWVNAPPMPLRQAG